MPNYDQIVISQCTYPSMEREALLGHFAALGFRQMEGFLEWTSSHLDFRVPAEVYLQESAKHELTYHSLHLPSLTAKGMSDDQALSNILAAIEFAGSLGVNNVYLRSGSEHAYIAHGKKLIDACENAGVNPLLEPHDNTPIPDTESTRRVLDAIDDPRLNVVLELGHISRAGDRCEHFYELMGGPASTGGRVASIHVKNTDPNGMWAPWREGVVDVEAIVERALDDGFAGDFVLECELGDPLTTGNELKEVRDYLKKVLS